MTVTDAPGRVVVVPGLTPGNGGDSPSARARARARVPGTPARGKTGMTTVRRGLARWWAWTARPVSLRALWRLSAVNSSRIPRRSAPLRALWGVSNYTDRLVWFVAVAVAPTALQGPLRWLAARPTRRVGFYLIAGALLLLIVA